MIKTLALFLIAGTVLISCSKGGSSYGSNNNTGGGGGGGSTLNCTGVANKFTADVKPIIDTKCATDASCHGAGSANGPGPLTNYTQISNAASQINTAVSSGLMPKTGTLTASEKNSILCWIQAGAQNN